MMENKKSKKTVAVVALSIIICLSTLAYVYSAGVFPNASFSYGVWYSGGTAVWENNEYYNAWNVRAYNYQNEWVLSWRVTNQRYVFWQGNWISVNIIADPDSQEGWFYIHSEFSTSNDPWNLGGAWLKISVARHLNLVQWIYHYTWLGTPYQGVIWQSNDAKYYNGTWEIYFERADPHGTYPPDPFCIRLYFTPSNIQAQSELVSTWSGSAGSQVMEWGLNWNNEHSQQGYLWVGISYYDLYHTNWMHFANLRVGYRIF
jgi:hypothetical protein